MPSKLNLAPRGTPCGKSRYYTPVEAEGHRSALESWEQVHGRKAPNLGPLRVYWCTRCEAYHVGHKTV
jgi:hypothetical protein